MFLVLMAISANAAGPSGSLPVMFIATQNGEPVVSKDDYLAATYYVDPKGVAGVEAVGSAARPDTLQIKGRGNWTWTGFEKKPYRIKLQNKTALLGLKKNKHFALLAHADDWTGWLKNTIGFILSEQLGLQWTPHQQPVEVVLNGDYIGLYMLTEVIRVDKDRVNVVEQLDGDNSDVTGGWLVEIDNYREPNCIDFTEPKNEFHREQNVMVTPKTPELLSSAQRDYLYAQMTSLNAAIYSHDSATLTSMLDIDEAARFYLVQELMLDCESYHGSCYLHKQQGTDAKWFFGPVWDFGNAFNRCRWGNPDMPIYVQPEFSQVWIGELSKDRVFQAALAKIWAHWRYYDVSLVSLMVASFVNRIAAAAAADALRWEQYDHSNMRMQQAEVMKYFHQHVEWLTTQWGGGYPDPEPTACRPSADPLPAAQKRIVDGQLVIIRNGRIFSISGVQK